jgi:hypothetical protein
MLGNRKLGFHMIWSIRCIYRPCTIIHQSNFEVRQIGILPVRCMTHCLMNYKVRDVNSMSKSTVVICPHKEERLPEMEHIPLHQMPSSQSILATQAYRVELTPMGGESNADFLIVTTYAITDATTTIKKVTRKCLIPRRLYHGSRRLATMKLPSSCLILVITVTGMAKGKIMHSVAPELSTSIPASSSGTIPGTRDAPGSVSVRLTAAVEIRAGFSGYRSQLSALSVRTEGKSVMPQT